MNYAIELIVYVKAICTIRDYAFDVVKNDTHL